MYRILKYNYLFDANYQEGKIFYNTLEEYKLSLIYAGTRFKKRTYLVRQSDVEWLTNEDLVDAEEKLQTVMLTCGSVEHVKHWLYDKIAHNYEMLICTKEVWIPVEISLPKPARIDDISTQKPVHVTYLSYSDNEPYCDCLALYCEDGFWRWYDNQCFFDDMEIVKVKITAWHPLIKPYKI